jgi:hypothetical protein
MRAGQVGQGQIAQPVLVLIDKVPALVAHMPVLPMRQQRCPQPGGTRLDHLQRRRILRADNAGNQPLDDPRLFARDARQRVAKIPLVIHRHRGDDRQRRPRDHVGGVEPPAKPHLEQRVIRPRARHGEDRSTGGDLEIGNRHAAIGSLAFIQNRRQVILGNERARQPDTFVEARQMRRGIGVTGLSRRLDPCADHGQCAALAIGAGNMDHRRQPVLRIAQRVQQPPHAVERQVDDLGVQRHHP